jgi:hypothetical protein
VASGLCPGEAGARLPADDPALLGVGSGAPWWVFDQGGQHHDKQTRTYVRLKLAWKWSRSRTGKVSSRHLVYPLTPRRRAVSKYENPPLRMAFESDAARALALNNPGWSAVAEDDPRWRPYLPCLRHD